MMKKANIVLALVCGSLMASAMLLATGCSQLGLACTQIACHDQVLISIHGLEANQLYEAEIETADQTIRCTIDTGEDTHEDMRMSCDNVLLYFSQPGEASITLASTPDSVAITILQNGTVITQDVVAPDYHEVAPNGEACGPICDQAEISLAL
jgi:hypothetical protein